MPPPGMRAPLPPGLAPPVVVPRLFPRLTTAQSSTIRPRPPACRPPLAVLQERLAELQEQVAAAGQTEGEAGQDEVEASAEVESASKHAEVEAAAEAFQIELAKPADVEAAAVHAGVDAAAKAAAAAFKKELAKLAETAGWRAAQRAEEEAAAYAIGDSSMDAEEMLKRLLRAEEAEQKLALQETRAMEVEDRLSRPKDPPVLARFVAEVEEVERKIAELKLRYSVPPRRQLQQSVGGIPSYTAAPPTLP